MISLHWNNRLSFLTRKDLALQFSEAGFNVTAEEWAVLLILWNKGAQTPGMIADVTFRDRTTVTRLVDGMVKKGLIERGTDPDDRRKSILKASDRALKLKDNLVPIARDLISEAQAGLCADDIQTTVRVLRTMTENLMERGKS